MNKSEAEKYTPPPEESKIIDITPEHMPRDTDTIPAESEPATSEEIESTLANTEEDEQHMIENLETLIRALRAEATPEEQVTLQEQIREATQKIQKLGVGTRAFIKDLPGGTIAYGLAKFIGKTAMLPARVASAPSRFMIRRIRRASKEASSAMDEYEQQAAEQMSEQEEPPAAAA